MMRMLSTVFSISCLFLMGACDEQPSTPHWMAEYKESKPVVDKKSFPPIPINHAPDELRHYVNYWMANHPNGQEYMLMKIAYRDGKLWLFDRLLADQPIAPVELNYDATKRKLTINEPLRKATLSLSKGGRALTMHNTRYDLAKADTITPILYDYDRCQQLKITFATKKWDLRQRFKGNTDGEAHRKEREKLALYMEKESKKYQACYLGGKN